MTKRKRPKLPPPGLRKVPGAKVWMDEAGQPWGRFGKLTPHLRPGGHAMGKTPAVSFMLDGPGRRMTSATVPRLMAATWMPPKPAPDAQIEHLDGDPCNNAASNLAWRVPNGAERRRADWREALLAKMRADPSDPHHGTKVGYDAGCRCRRCFAAQKVKKLEYATRKTIAEVEEACGTTAR